MIASPPADWLWRAATWRNVGIAVATSVAFSFAFELWRRAMHVPREERVGMTGLPSASELAAKLAGISDAGRRYALRSTLTLDVLYPLVYSTFLSLLVARLLQRHGHASWQAVRFVPFAGALVDYAENAWIVLWATGRRTAEEAARPLSVLSPAKWASILLSVVIALFAFLL